MSNILIISDNFPEADDVTRFCQEHNIQVFFATTVSDALKYFNLTELLLIVLDENLSVADDHRILKAMRKAKSTPILVLSSNNHRKNRLEILKAGAHAYLGNPYTFEEALAQAQSLMLMYEETHPEEKQRFTLVHGNDLVIVLESRQVFLKGKELHFTRKEFDLLLLLASNAGQVLSKEQLYNHIWEYDSAYNVDEVIKAHIKSLRKKLSGADFEYIKNVWGVGYRFEKDNRN